MTAIYSGGHFSGAHYNPAVTLAILIRGKISAKDAALYMLSQCCGSVFGGLVGMVALKSDVALGAPEIADGVNVGSAFVAELILTLALAHVVLNVTTTTAQANNSYYGLAIGFTVMSGAISVGGVSGVGFNPAIKLLSFLRALNTGRLGVGAWVGFVAPFLGSALAGAIFVITQPDELNGLLGRFGSDHPTAATRKRIAPYVYEVLGTFLLCFTVATAAASSNSSGLAPLSIGAMLAGQVYAGGSTSGANYNPAVTVALAVRKAEYFVTSIGYIGAQIGGGFLALLLSRLVIVRPKVIGFPNPGEGYSVGHAFWAEIFATFFLCFVVLQVATNSLVAGNNFFGLAIGFTMTAMAVAVGPVSGGAFNPAIDLLGLALGGKHYIYWSAPFIGAILAGCACRRTARTHTARTHTARTHCASALSTRGYARSNPVLLPLRTSLSHPLPVRTLCAVRSVTFRLMSPLEGVHTPERRRSSIKVAAERKSLVHAEVDPARQSLMKYNPTVAKEEGRERFNSIDEVSLSFDAKALLSSKPPAPKEPKAPKAPAKGEEKEEEALPEGWKIIKDEAGDFEYFYNEESGESVWTREELPMTAEAAKRYEAALNKARELCTRLVAEKSCAPILVRLAWHDSGTFDNREEKPWPEMGGAIGSIRTAHEINAGPNAGLKGALDSLLRPIKQACPQLSWADLIQLASATAIEASGGPKIPMTYGRVDGLPSEPMPAPFGLPDAKPPFGGPEPDDPAAHLRYVFYKYGMDDRDIVALSGAHTLGRAFKDRSGAVDDGFDGGSEYTKKGCPFLQNSKTTGGRPWTKHWLKFDNSYFTDMPEDDPECVAFPTDKVLMSDPDFKAHFVEFAESQSAFFKQYAVSHKKLSELGSKFCERFNYDAEMGAIVSSSI